MSTGGLTPERAIDALGSFYSHLLLFVAKIKGRCSRFSVEKHQRVSRVHLGGPWTSKSEAHEERQPKRKNENGTCQTNGTEVYEASDEAPKVL
jgi:hypothetical protein